MAAGCGSDSSDDDASSAPATTAAPTVAPSSDSDESAASDDDHDDDDYDEMTDTDDTSMDESPDESSDTDEPMDTDESSDTDESMDESDDSASTSDEFMMAEDGGPMYAMGEEAKPFLYEFMRWSIIGLTASLDPEDIEDYQETGQCIATSIIDAITPERSVEIAVEVSDTRVVRPDLLSPDEFDAYVDNAVAACADTLRNTFRLVSAGESLPDGWIGCRENWLSRPETVTELATLVLVRADRATLQVTMSDLVADCAEESLRSQIIEELINEGLSESEAAEQADAILSAANIGEVPSDDPVAGEFTEALTYDFMTAPDGGPVYAEGDPADAYLHEYMRWAIDSLGELFDPALVDQVQALGTCVATAGYMAVTPERAVEIAADLSEGRLGRQTQVTDDELDVYVDLAIANCKAPLQETYRLLTVGTFESQHFQECRDEWLDEPHVLRNIAVGAIIGIDPASFQENFADLIARCADSAIEETDDFTVALTYDFMTAPDGGPVYAEGEPADAYLHEYMRWTIDALRTLFDATLVEQFQATGTCIATAGYLAVTPERAVEIAADLSEGRLGRPIQTTDDELDVYVDLAIANCKETLQETYRRLTIGSWSQSFKECRDEWLDEPEVLRNLAVGAITGINLRSFQATFACVIAHCAGQRP